MFDRDKNRAFTAVCASILSKPFIKPKCIYKKRDTGKGYNIFKSGCRIELGELPIGWDYCPYCSKEIDRGDIL